MRPQDLGFALIVVVVWGLNFAVIKSGVADVPPMLLGAMRFLLAALPAIFFLRAPRLPLRLYLVYGLTISFAQFAFLFTAIHVGMPTGLASLVAQSQAFFTMIMAALWLKEAWRVNQLIGLLLAGAGLVLIGSTHGVAMPLLGFMLSLSGAAMWAVGNIVTREISKHGPIDQLAFVAWASLVPVPAFMLASYWMEGPAAIGKALAGFNFHGFLVIAYLSWGATLLGYGLWTRLLTKYPANQVAPFSLLVPIVGLTTGWIVFDETLGPLHFAGAALLMLGLLVNLFGGRLLAVLRPGPAA